MSAGESNCIYKVGVKTLIEFSAKSGSLDRRFTPAPSGQEGIAGHQQVVKNRPSHFVSEYSLSLQFENLLLRGRVDGLDPEANTIEEIKTYHGELDLLPENHKSLHWAQVKLYGWMYCLQENIENINLSVVYYHINSRVETKQTKAYSRQQLQEFCEPLLKRYIQWQQIIQQRQLKLNQWISDLTFPYPEFRDSQRLMAEAVYKSAATGKTLLVEAPTGTGKTLASLFPSIKAISNTPADKIFYLTSKTTGKHLALDTLKLLSEPSSAIRILELTAIEKACHEPELFCHGESCPLARGFYTKLDQARLDAYERTVLDKQALDELALKHQICPFYLSLEMSRWVDVIVADINYYFDGSPLLLNLTKQFEWKPVLLIDESHNLIDRGSSMYSAGINRADLLAAKRSSPPALAKPLNKINKLWLDLLKHEDYKNKSFSVLPEPPEKLSQAFTTFINAYTQFLQKNPQHSVQHSATQHWFFAVVNYLNKLDMLGDDYAADLLTEHPRQEEITLRNLIPARLLKERLESAHCACFFSATLQPAHYYQTMLGIEDNSVCMELPSPFDTEQLAVNFSNQISTRYKDRSSAIAPMSDVVFNQVTSAPGNYLAFFSSYEFLHQVLEKLSPLLIESGYQIINQQRNMTEQNRADFINTFRTENNVFGFAVLGGVFSEGIDLPGDALTGTFIATLGLPQFNPVNEFKKQFLQEKFGQGYQFTYLYPGIQKVVQAAGRVIRTQSDKGSVWLLDDRFNQPEVKRLLPRWWNIH